MLPALILMASLALAAPVEKRSEAGPVIPDTFPDPSLINIDNVWYAFGTASNGKNIQIAESADFNTWKYDDVDALPTLPPWAYSTSPNVWAPDVIQLADGSFVLYFAATSGQNMFKHCVGAATSKSIKGPYMPMANPLACPLDQGGAIDASATKDNGQIYVTYKIDGNSQGHGGACGNQQEPIVSTAIMLQQMAADGVTPQGDAVKILDNNGAADQGIVEAPSLIKRPAGGYLLFFSSGCYSGDGYTVSYATAQSIAGPYTRQGALMQTGSFGLTSPGGADLDPDGVHVVFHAGPPDTRKLYTALVGISGDKVSL